MFAQFPGHIVGQQAAAASTPYTDWTHIAHDQYSANAPADNQLTMVGDFTQTIYSGMALRIQDATGVEVDDAGGQTSAYHNITGLDVATLSARGRLYIDVVDDTGGYRHIDLYRKPLTSPRTAADKVAHTATYNSTGAKALTADNSSGVGGTITVDAVGAADDYYVEFWKWVVVYTITSTLITFHGPSISTTAGRIQNLWWGNANRVQQWRQEAVGDPTDPNVSFMLSAIWWGPCARFAHVCTWIYYSGITPLTVDFLGGVLPAPINFGNNSDHSLNSALCRLDYGTLLDTAVAGGGGEDRGHDVIIEVTVVLE